ncbi:uncharacterized protein BX664DRAFT_319138 [Halteromyces radiatus]|uniref:uncharacterized protein n=1 Tax=Halteromyces radiatus TaxID=101107 RepID=UPI00221ECB8D|nr:uncharacterized protein BX664DRAFT_319138 [Halteromyces radiatus]KAI8098605.1 hypothetical protein BX664DRAFT_319138 [Halteromyces radiatus]
MPKLLSFTPNHGQEGTLITIVLEGLPIQPVKLAFNSLVVDTKLIRSQQTTTLMATIPNFDMTLSTSNIVPTSVCFLNEKDIVEDTFYLANFTYRQSNNDYSPHYQHDRKRSFASLSDDDYSSSTNKRVHQDVQYPYDTSVTSSPYSQIPPYSSYYQYQQQRGTNTYSSLPERYHPNQLPMIMESPVHMQSYQSSYGGSSNHSSPTLYSPSVSQRRKSYQRPNVQSLKSTSHQPSTSVDNYQPYPGLVSQCNFELIDDLHTMTQNWNALEQQQGRRLVRFWREDKPHDLIQCCFESVSQNDSAATDTNNTVVSCIYWPEHNDYFITSVDCIYLLESLMKTHFGVEEKNRIRRNLEGFRPLTVAKCKPISAEFFKRVMGFPHPKPRNIEKDIKAFTWKILPYALKKIIMKYSVTSSTSDTASGLYSSHLVTQSNTSPQHSYHHSLLMPSTSSSTTSIATTSTTSPSSPSSATLATPPVTEHDQFIHQPIKQQPLYYNPTTMTYGYQQEPGVRSRMSISYTPPYSTSSSTSSSSYTVASPSSSPPYLSEQPMTIIPSNATTSYTSVYASSPSSTQPIMTSTTSSTFVSQLMMDNTPCESDFLAKYTS